MMNKISRFKMSNRARAGQGGGGVGAREQGSCAGTGSDPLFIYDFHLSFTMDPFALILNF